MRRYSNRVYCLQPRRRRLTLPPRKPRDSRDSHLCAHLIIPAHHPPRHDGLEDRCALRRTRELLGKLRWTGEGRAPSGGLCHSVGFTLSICKRHAPRVGEAKTGSTVSRGHCSGTPARNKRLSMIGPRRRRIWIDRRTRLGRTTDQRFLKIIENLRCLDLLCSLGKFDGCRDNTW